MRDIELETFLKQNLFDQINKNILLSEHISKDLTNKCARKQINHLERMNCTISEALNYLQDLIDSCR